MGGHALKNISQERLPRDKYLELEKDIINKIKELLPTYYVPRYFPNKETFGDLDILYHSNITKQDLLQEIIKLLDSKEYITEGQTISCEYNNFQIDFIKVEEEYYEFNKCFLDFSGFGQILSRMFKGHELKYRHNGLYLKVYENHNPTKCLDEIYLTDDVNKMFNFLGLDFNKFQEGFEREEELYYYLVNCNYFAYGIYLENQNHIIKKRIEKRPIYEGFINFITNKQKEENLKETNKLKESKELDIEIVENYEENINFVDFFKNDKDEFVSYVLNYFDKQIEYEKIIEKEKNKVIIKSKFNGKIVEKITNLKNKNLGKFIELFKNELKNENDNFEEFILNNEEYIINDRIRLFFDSYKNL